MKNNTGGYDNSEDEQQSRNHLAPPQVAFKTEESQHSKRAVNNIESDAVNLDITGMKTVTGRGKSENTKDGIDLKKMVLYDGKTGMVMKLNRSSEKSDESKASEEEKTVSVMSGMIYSTNHRYKRQDSNSKPQAPPRPKKELLLKKL